MSKLFNQSKSTKRVILFTIIGGVYQVIPHCLIPKHPLYKIVLLQIITKPLRKQKSNFISVKILRFSWFLNLKFVHACFYHYSGRRVWTMDCKFNRYSKFYSQYFLLVGYKIWVLLWDLDRAGWFKLEVSKLFNYLLTLPFLKF